MVNTTVVGMTLIGTSISQGDRGHARLPSIRAEATIAAATAAAITAAITTITMTTAMVRTMAVAKEGEVCTMWIAISSQVWTATVAGAPLTILMMTRLAVVVVDLRPRQNRSQPTMMITTTTMRSS